MDEDRERSEWLSGADLAAWLGVSRRTVEEWRYHGRGPVGHRVGRFVRYRRADVERWLAENRDARATA